jgi:hypothetical protein
MSIAFKFFLKLHRREKNKQTHAFQLQGEFSEMLADTFMFRNAPWSSLCSATGFL